MDMCKRVGVGLVLAANMTVALAAPVAAPVDAVASEHPVVTETLLADTYVRLQKLNQDGLAVRNYQLAKALAFLDEARHEFYLRNDSGIVFDFVESAQIIAEALENGIYIGTGNRRFAASEPVAPALWQRIEQLKTGPVFACQGDLVARAEVELLAAGNDQYLLGWRAAVARIRMAEERLDQAMQVTGC